MGTFKKWSIDILFENGKISVVSGPFSEPLTPEERKALANFLTPFVLGKDAG